MKRLLVVFLIICFAFSLSGCCNHEWQEATCTEPKTCAKCGATEGEALGHDYSEWQITAEPTFSAEGEQEQTCSRCGDVLKEAIPQKSLDSVSVTDEQGFCVTYEEFFELYESYLNAEIGNYASDEETANAASDYLFFLTETEKDNIRMVYYGSPSINLSLKTSVLLTKDGDKPTPDGKFDQALMAMMDTKASLDDIKWFFTFASLVLIEMTDEEIDSLEEAYDVYQEIVAYYGMNDGDIWYKHGDFEYKMCLTEAGGSGNDTLYLLSFAAHYVG